MQWKQDIDEAARLITKAMQIDDKCEFAYETLGTIEIQRLSLFRQFHSRNSETVILVFFVILPFAFYSALHTVFCSAEVMQENKQLLQACCFCPHYFESYRVTTYVNVFEIVEKSET